MMEKRNFVTRARTPMDGASDIDDIIAAGVSAFGTGGLRKTAMSRSLEKKASEEDEKADAEGR